MYKRQVRKLLEYRPEAIVAVGGGSAIDSSKSIREFALKVDNYGAVSYTHLDVYKRQDPFSLIPVVLGHEGTGEIVKMGKNVCWHKNARGKMCIRDRGEGVTKVKVGDRVSGAPLLPCMKCDDCQNGNFSLCKHYSFIGSRQQGSNADYVVIPEQMCIRDRYLDSSVIAHPDKQIRQAIL